MADPSRRSRRTFAVVTLLVAASSLLAQDATATRKGAISTTSVSAEVGRVTFSGNTDPWRLASVSMWRRTRNGTFIARVNYANRYATDGVQVEVDAYPRVSDKVYLYLNTGYSQATVFPDWRWGAEAFTTLPAAWEASFGVRQLRFGGTPVTLITGAVGKYLGNYWVSLRPYLRQKQDGMSLSAGLTARRYYEDADHWVGVAASYGSSPTDRITPDAIGRLRALSLSVSGSSGLSRRLLGTWTLGRDSEQLGRHQTRDSFTLTAGLKLGL